MEFLVQKFPRLEWLPTMSRWLGALCFIAVVTLALAPKGTVPKLALLEYDKLNHVLAFAALSVLFTSGWLSQPRWLIAVTLLSAGVGVELLQTTELINREFHWLDIASNAVGIAIGLGLAAVFQTLSARSGASFADRT